MSEQTVTFQAQAGVDYHAIVVSGVLTLRLVSCRHRHLLVRECSAECYEVMAEDE